MIIIISVLVLIWWTINTVAALADESKQADPPPITNNPPQIITPQPVPVVYSSPDPQPVPPVISQAPKLKPYNPPQKTPEREKLENTAAGMLTICGCRFDVYGYVRQKSDLELMEIIKDYNLNK